MTDDRVWKALASPHRRSLLDLLAAGPRTTGELAGAYPELSRYGVMQHLGVLEDAGLVLVRRRGRQRFNYLNAVPVRELYERWVGEIAGAGAAEVLALRRHVERGGDGMGDDVRVVRVENELRFRAPAERVFAAMTTATAEWFPHSYGGERLKAITVEGRPGGRFFEDWGEDSGHVYGLVQVWDPPASFTTRAWLGLGVTLDTEYTVAPDGDETVLRVAKVAVGPMTDDDAGAIRTYGDLEMFEAPLRAWIEGPVE